MLKRMDAHGVNMQQTEDDKPLISTTSGALLDRIYSVYWNFIKMERKEAEELASKQGAKILSAVSSNLNILVVGERQDQNLKGRILGYGWNLEWRSNLLRWYLEMLIWNFDYTIISTTFAVLYLYYGRINRW